MIKISLPYVFRLASALEALGTLPAGPSPFADVWWQLWLAENMLSTLLDSSVFSPYLRTSGPLGRELQAHLRVQVNNQNHAREVSTYELWTIKNSYKSYNTALLAELESLGSYFVTQKGPFDTYTLLAWGENLLPFEALTKAPEAIYDAREAGKCLAFELANACGFHMFRATEAVLRKYFRT